MLKDDVVKLGLDLQGGMHVTLEVSPIDIVKGLSGNNQDKDFIEEANGQAKIETYTVVNSREGPTKGIIIGRLETGKRFIANTRRDKDLLMKMMQNEMLNVQGIVKFEDSRNIFEPS